MKDQAKESGSRTSGTDAFDELRRDAAFHQLKINWEEAPVKQSAESCSMADGDRFWTLYACSPMSHPTHSSGGASDWSLAAESFLSTAPTFINTD